MKRIKLGKDVLIKVEAKQNLSDKKTKISQKIKINYFLRFVILSN
jgi:hypothetical protein